MTSAVFARLPCSYLRTWLRRRRGWDDAGSSPLLFRGTSRRGRCGPDRDAPFGSSDLPTRTAGAGPPVSRSTMTTADVSEDCLRRLLKAFVASAYVSADPGPMGKEAMSKVVELFSLDYHITWVDNAGGYLCELYPEKLILVEGEKDGGPDTAAAGCLNTARRDCSDLRALILEARSARARMRFPFPSVFLVRNNNNNADVACLCRSATINDSDFSPERAAALRKLDAQLLSGCFGTNVIFNLMFEGRKVKPGTYVTSTEAKDETGSYAGFDLADAPFADVLFFTSYPKTRRDARGWKFEWSAPRVEVPVCISWEEHRFRDHQQWDVIRLTREYLEVILDELDGKRNNSGVLVHCISGWDRTPVFCALVRIILWADGRVHKNLSSLQMVYLTVAYDWYLFGHQLGDRVARGAEIMFFCFEFLRHHAEDLRMEGNQNEAKCNKLMEVRNLFREAYSATVGL